MIIPPLVRPFPPIVFCNLNHNTNFTCTDYAFLPSLYSSHPNASLLYEDGSEDVIRVPILPDNTTAPSISTHAEEHIDGAIHGEDVVAANPDNVIAGISEVVGNDGLDVDIGQLGDAISSLGSGSGGKEEEEGEVGIFVELWRSMIEDIFGPRESAKTA